MTLKPGDSLGRYTINEEIGHGGMATVYRAHQPALSRDVAIKVLPDFFAEDAAFRDRFAREAAIVARLRHANIVTVFDFGEEAGTSFIVTEFVAGQTLQARLESALSLDESVAILRPLASALDYAHEHGVLHRDVKPSNVILSREGTPILTDFGLSRIVGSLPPLTRTGMPMGTPEYMAPELASGDSASESVDNYALAVMAYEMLTGTVPYRAETPLAVLLAHVNRRLRPPTELNPALPSEVDEVLLKALEKEPDERYLSAGEFVSALESACAGVSFRTTAREMLRPAPAPTEEATPSSRRERLPDFRQGHAGSRAPAPRAPAEHPPRAHNARMVAAAAAVQHPIALFPSAAAALAVVYAAILAPEQGYGTLAYGAAAIGAALGAAGFIRRYPRELATATVANETTHERERYESEHEALRRLHETLHHGYSSLGSRPGLGALVQLTREFEQLEPALNRRSESDGITLAAVPSLSIETYRRGLSVLVDALELTDATHSSATRRLIDEAATMEREIQALKSKPGQDERLRMAEAKLESHRERLRLVDDLQLRIDRLLYQAGRCEASLHRTRIDLAAIRTGASESNIDSVIQSLQKTIAQAKAVQDEIRRLGY